ncbi:MAG: glycine--tRNA ligase subunit beta [Caldisericia bacterium]|jgi:glycyl-tRNA synthetase beta chain|nr:glycine--tRNA ligase subunit beta [Caldisericia bacterium]
MGNKLLIEVGVEEIPARFLNEIGELIKKNFSDFLNSEAIEYKNLQIFFTPRRLVIFVDEISERQKDRVLKVKGPKKSLAFNENGEPLTPLKGFLQKNDSTIDDIKIEKVGDEEYVFIEKKMFGKDTKELIRDNFQKILFSIPIRKPMKWDSLSFVRPIRWILSMFNDELININIGDIKSKRETRRFLKTSMDYIKINSVDDYFESIKKEGIILSFEERKKIILEELSNFEKELQVEINKDEDLLNEVTNLVESPKVFYFTLPSKGRDLPYEILVEILIKGARVFPGKKNNEIIYAFGVQNGIFKDSNIIKEGFMSVVKAKIDDALFFFSKDKEIPIKNRIDGLKNIIFEKNLGTYYDKTIRLIKLLKNLYNDLKLTEEEKALLDRAALLSMSDLTTLTVQEYPELHGIIGGFLCIESNEEKDVCEIIKEFIYPRKKDDRLPESKLPKILGIIDRIDTLVGSFLVKLEPTSSEDPMGLRRVSLTLLKLLISFENSISINNLIDYSLKTFEDSLKKDFNLENILKFIKNRFRGILEEENLNYDIINAVINVEPFIPYKAYVNSKFIKNIYNEEPFNNFVLAYKRVYNITKNHNIQGEIKENLFEKDEEKNLYEFYLNIKNEIEKRNIIELEKVYNKFIESVNIINKFFDNILVMVDDEKIKINRLNLLKNLLNIFRKFGHFEEILKQ